MPFSQRIHPGARLLALSALAALAPAMAQTADPQWLEPPHDARALEWARAKTAASEAAIRAMPAYAQVKAELAGALATGAAEPDITLMGPRALRFFRDAAHPYGLLQRADRDADGLPGPWRTVLDVGQLRQAEGTPFELQAYDLSSACLAPTFARCLLRLSPAGGDEVEIREFDLDAARFVDDGFRTPKARAFAEWMGPDQVLVEHTADGAPTTMAGWPASVRLWQRGEPLARAREVYAAQPTDAIVQLFAVGEGAQRRGVIVRAIDYSTFEVFGVGQDGAVEQAPLPRALKPMAVQALVGGQVVVQLGVDATVEGTAYPAETLLAWNTDPATAGARVTRIYTPADGDYLGGRSDIASAQGKLAFVVNQLLVPRVLLATPGEAGWRVDEAIAGAPGDTLSVRGGGSSADDLIMTREGFVAPRRQSLYRPGQPLRLLAEDRSLFDGAGYITEIRTATSRDGTTVDYWLLRPKTLAPGPQPLFMTGYGAFGISYRPGYFDHTVGGPAFKLWLDRGGSLAIPAVRGGGERGEAWHQAAIRTQRQRSYDDFIAVAEQLVSSGYTVPAKIGVFGMSNGGLLSATLGTQRPELFGAVVSDVPLTDLIRMRHMGMGAAWINEYGDPDKPDEAAAMLAYSPMQNVRAGVTYPPFLVTISTEDNRVGPGHARKLAARLDDVGAPVYFLENEEGGHGVSDAFRNPELMALRMTFLIDTLLPATNATP
ncbi:prolyl oligopeptidase family serine peptidase [Luteimonas sp. TWI1437]|uniref:prolyl oligopeptidase family serine peptidase n=1 Tax=unclassified Luteimonas TaxID=2629088 RepID=UPI00320905F0